jgi:hypothetical protein
VPRPIRFLAVWFAGNLIALISLPLLAGWQSPSIQAWTGLTDWLWSTPFWSVAWLLVVLTCAALLFARLGARAGLSGPVSGLVGGMVTGMGYLLFYAAGSGLSNEGLMALLQFFWPGAALFIGTLGLSGAFMSWFWNRLT